jgi:hypothetical protein
LPLAQYLKKLFSNHTFKDSTQDKFNATFNESKNMKNSQDEKKIGANLQKDSSFKNMKISKLEKEKSIILAKISKIQSLLLFKSSYTCSSEEDEKKKIK